MMPLVLEAPSDCCGTGGLATGSGFVSGSCVCLRVRTPLWNPDLVPDCVATLRAKLSSKQRTRLTHELHPPE